ncbi:MAG: arginine--tRNA ligase [Clostridiales bacterium]|nr:arginine--tRNA ligase [Clostridiales bacterium]
MDFKTLISEVLAKAADRPAEEIYNALEVPKAAMGDYAFPCFKLSKIFRKAPPAIAEYLAGEIVLPEYLEKIEVVGGYINFFIDKTALNKSVLDKILTEGGDYIKSKEGEGKTVCIDYSSPNIAKPFHIGHLRSTVIGNSLYRIYGALGYNMVGINHLGDWGTQFGKLISAYKRWGNKEDVERIGISELTRLYVLFHTKAEENPELNDEARGYLVKMQNGDEEALSLWKWFVDISMREFQRVYDMLDITFDSYAGESFYNDKMPAVVEEIKSKGILEESDGAQVVNLEKYKMPPCLILRRDGGTLYPTRDITAALYRKDTYNFSKCLYVTAVDQKLHFAQWFKVLELMGYDWAATELVHIPFGLVNLGTEGKLSTRTGHVVLMEDVLKEAVEKTKAIIEEKNPDLEDKEEIAKEAGIGAVIFDDMFNGRIKNIAFDWNKILNFEGETGPYVQYTHARACSLLRKAEITGVPSEIDYSLISDESSQALIKAMGDLPQKIKDAAEKYEPYIISRQLIEICQSFNRFYRDNSVLGSEGETKKARLALVYAAKTAIKEGLYLLGIKAPERM